ncbi:class I SAM-dependent methyltransferase [Candidatus Pelagibacter ubique]|nr:class I SAM-dependent methyltransferase [Candidatus Pelagibacter ubique]
MHNKCKICLEEKYYKVDFNNFFLRTDSGNKSLHDYDMRICDNCGVVYQYPQISNEEVTKHYESSYRRTNSPIDLDKEYKIDFPLHFEQTGISFQRFYYFYKIIEKVKKTEKELVLDNNTTILDCGAYQGAFLYACQKVWNVKTIGNDYNEDGLKFAKNYLNINETYKSKDIYTDVFNENINICSAIQVLEHLHDPIKFLKHIKKNVLKNKGYIYIEVPCAESSTYDDPTHLFMYTKESLGHLFNLCGLKVLHISVEKIYNYSKIKLLKRHVQTMVHCFAKTDGDENFDKKVNQGSLILKRLEKVQKKNSNEIYFIRLKFFIKEGLILGYHGFFILFSFFSSKISFKIYIMMTSFLKKFYMNVIKRK